MTQRTWLNEDVYLCMKLVAPYVDITTQLHLNDIIASYKGMPLVYTCHNPAWDLQHVTDTTLQRVVDVILSSYFRIGTDYITEYNGIRSFYYERLFIYMSLCRNVIAAQYALFNSTRVCANPCVVSSIMSNIVTNAAAIGSASLFRIACPQTPGMWRALYTEESKRLFYSNVFDALCEAAVRGHVQIFVETHHWYLPYEMKYVTNTVRCDTVNGIRVPEQNHTIIRFAFYGGHQAMIDYILKRGVDVYNTEKEYFIHALNGAVSGDHTHLVKTLFDRATSFPSSLKKELRLCMYQAVFNNNQGSLMYLIMLLCLMNHCDSLADDLGTYQQKVFYVATESGRYTTATWILHHFCTNKTAMLTYAFNRIIAARRSHFYGNKHRYLALRYLAHDCCFNPCSTIAQYQTYDLLPNVTIELLDYCAHGCAEALMVTPLTTDMEPEYDVRVPEDERELEYHQEWLRPPPDIPMNYMDNTAVYYS